MDTIKEAFKRSLDLFKVDPSDTSAFYGGLDGWWFLDVFDPFNHVKQATSKFFNIKRRLNTYPIVPSLALPRLPAPASPSLGMARSGLLSSRMFFSSGAVGNASIASLSFA